MRGSHGSGTVDAATRALMLSDREHRCQWCGARGPPRGTATLHVHHIERGPSDVPEDDPVNLAVTCRVCHNWFHHRPTVEDAPVSLTDADMEVLLSHDVLLLQVLAEIGPASFRDVYTRVKVLLSEPAVRERLWVLMGLDQLVTGREEQLVDQDATTGRWGFPEDISTSARGHVPDNRALAFQRAEDELVRRALARGCDRDLVGSVFGVTRRNTFHKQYRAAAYVFPLDEFDRGGRPAERDDDVDDTSDLGAEDATAETTEERTVHESLSDIVDGSDIPDDSHERVTVWGKPVEGAATPMNELLHEDDSP